MSKDACATVPNDSTEWKRLSSYYSNLGKRFKDTTFTAINKTLLLQWRIAYNSSC